ncbi:MAG TPA: MerR family transcriptional regulator [Alphaproteobacteria bacterium]|nr:MerR family transcriptional regulator [Alphaproteobacteria bacterium]
MEPSARPATKSPTAFRTISEVSADLNVPQHVLRFWETKFPQIRPLKRGGGRRYYRPEDVELLRRIQALLYKEGYTIKGVQRLLKERRSLDLADGEVPPPDAEDADELELELDVAEEPEPAPAPEAAPLAEPAVAAASAAAVAAVATDLSEERRGALLAIRGELVALRDLLRSAG